MIPGILILFASRGSNADIWLMLMFLPAALHSLVKYLSFRYRFAADELTPALREAEARRTLDPKVTGAFAQIGARHPIVLVVEELGDAAHADAADPDEVDVMDLASHSLRLPSLLAQSARILRRCPSPRRGARA